MKLSKVLAIVALLNGVLKPLGFSQSYSTYSTIDELIAAEN